MGSASVGNNTKKGETNQSLSQNVRVEKILSYNANSEFFYYYPRVIFEEKYIDTQIKLLGLSYDLDFIIASINHLIEVLCINFEDFLELMMHENSNDSHVFISINDLLFDIFKEEFSQLLRPLLSLSTSYIQVEAPYDKFYFLSKVHGYAYRIDKTERLQSFKIHHHDLTEISFTKIVNNKLGRRVNEQISTVLSTKIYSWFR